MLICTTKNFHSFAQRKWRRRRRIDEPWVLNADGCRNENEDRQQKNTTFESDSGGIYSLYSSMRVFVWLELLLEWKGRLFARSFIWNQILLQNSAQKLNDFSQGCVYMDVYVCVWMDVFVQCRVTLWTGSLNLAVNQCLGAPNTKMTFHKKCSKHVVS